MNLAQESTLAKINENIQKEGGQPYSPTERKQAGGGTTFITKLSDTVQTSEPEPPEGGVPVIQQSDFLIDKSRPTKYTARVGEGTVIAEQGALYQVKLSDTLGPSQPESYLYKVKLEDSIGGPEKEIETIPFIPAGYTPIGPAGSNLLIKTEQDYRILPAYGPQPKPEKQGPPTLQETLIETAKQTYLSLGVDIAKESLQFGVPQYTKPIKAKLEPYRKDVPIDIISQPERYGEIPALIKTPKFQASLAAFASTLFIPGKKLPTVKKFAFQSEKSKVRQLESEYLKEAGKVSGSEKIGESTYIISKGTETKPAAVPLTVVKFPKKGSATVREITPEPKVLSPSEINIQGGLFPGFVKRLEAKKIGPYQYQTKEPSLAARQEYQRGIFGGGIKPIAAGRTAKVADILSGSSKRLQQAAREPKATYAQTQAETKFVPPKNLLIPGETGSQKGLRKFEYGPEPIKLRIGAGQAARGFTLQETKTIKDMLKTEVKTEKPREDFLGTINAPIFLQAQEAESLTIQYPPGTKAEQFTLTQQKSAQQPLSITAQKLSISPKGKTISEQASKLVERTAQKTQLKIIQREELLPRLTTRPLQITRGKQTTIPKLVQKQVQKFKTIEVPRIPKEEIPKLRPPRLPFFVLPEPRKKQRKAPSEPKSAFEWKGNVPEFKIEGVYKKYDIIYGEKRVEKVSREERFGKPKRGVKKKYDLLGFPKTKKAKSNVSLW